MVLEKLENRSDFNNQKLSKSFKRFDFLINELHGHDLSQKTIDFINQQIILVNNAQEENTLSKQIRFSKRKILRILEKKHGIAPKGYYKKLWFLLGISIIGIPTGIGLGFILNSIEFVPVGWAIATIISFRIGRSKEEDVSRFGRQLNFRLRS